MASAAGTPLYLRPDVVVEPLVDRWYAWPHLVAPATAALNAKHRHLRILESYLAAPDIHEAAARDPALRGGPFVDLPTRDLDGIARLRDDTRRRRADQLAFADAIHDALRLVATADGHALEPLYAKLPPSLRGYVEIAYSMAHKAELRFIEPLLYRSPHRAADAQCLFLAPGGGDARPFALSTPRLDRPGTVTIPLDFADPAADALAALRERPLPYDQVAALLRVEGHAADVLRAMLVERVPPAPAKAPPARPRWRYFGHACVLVETPEGQSLLTDPFIAPPATSGGPPRFTLMDLPERIDFVVITHSHQDHLLFEALLALRPRIGTIVVPEGGGALADPSLRLMLNSCGFPRVVALQPLDRAGAGDLAITAVPFLGEHADLDIRGKSAYHVDAAGLTMIFAADSRNLDPPLYAHVRRCLGTPDLLFLGMECVGAPMSWLYGPLAPQPIARSIDQSRRLSGSDYAQALQMVRSLGCPRVFIYAMGQEPWLDFICAVGADQSGPALRAADALLAACADLGIPAERLYGMAEGSAES